MQIAVTDSPNVVVMSVGFICHVGAAEDKKKIDGIIKNMHIKFIEYFFLVCLIDNSYYNKLIKSLNKLLYESNVLYTLK